MSTAAGSLQSRAIRSGTCATRVQIPGCSTALSTQAFVLFATCCRTAQVCFVLYCLFCVAACAHRRRGAPLTRACTCCLHAALFSVSTAHVFCCASNTKGISVRGSSLAFVVEFNTVRYATGPFSSDPVQVNLTHADRIVVRYNN